MSHDLQDLRRAVRTHPSYRPDRDVLREVEPLLSRGSHREVVALVESWIPGALLSPAAHQVLAFAHERLGDAAAGARERRAARAALSAIEASGDGTAACPWQVLGVGDEYDVLRALGRRSVRQVLVRRGGVACDRHVCDDGSEAWFDVSAVVGAPGGTAT